MNGLSLKNTLDLSELAASKGLKERSLSGMHQELFGTPISKGEQQSNWEAHSLSHSQIQYAVNDVKAAYAIYKRLAGVP